MEQLRELWKTLYIVENGEGKMGEYFFPLEFYNLHYPLMFFSSYCSESLSWLVLLRCDAQSNLDGCASKVMSLKVHTKNVQHLRQSLKVHAKNVQHLRHLLPF